jgi:hypothetical protein
MKTTVMMDDTKSMAEQMDAIRNVIETGVVDIQTITTLKRVLTPKTTSTASLTISAKTKTAELTSSRAKRSTKVTNKVSSTVTIQESFPSIDLVVATKTVVMKSLASLAAHVDTRTKDNDSGSPSKAPKQPLSQGTRNIITCCKMALEALRRWQDHPDIGSAWANKAYFGYITKLTSLTLVNS